MNLFHIIKKNYFYLFIVCFTFVGVLLALNTGITHDEYHDLFVWKANQNLILNKLFNSNFDTSYITGGNLYYGSGFHYISFIVEFLTLQIPIIDNFDEEIKKFVQVCPKEMIDKIENPITFKSKEKEVS